MIPKTDRNMQITPEQVKHRDGNADEVPVHSDVSDRIVDVAARWREQFEKDDAEPRKDEDVGA